ncbi:MAG: cytochrome c biogenesis protein CcsA [Thermicanus sp.]|nr:cytochrome c biogenesis protein CcsA [Thermicanus sp.]
MKLLITMSQMALLLAFFLYIFATISYFISITGRKWRGVEIPDAHTEKWGKRGYLLVILGFIFQLIFVILRWIVGGHAPTSNMFEFMSFLSFSISLAFIIIYRIYKIPLLGMISIPIIIIMIAYASVFPTKITPLIPALKSYWLQIHVTTAALGEGAFAIAFAAGLLYLLYKVDQTHSNWENRLLEFTLWAILSLVGFLSINFLCKAIGFNEQFAVQNGMGGQMIITYDIPSIASPYQGEKITNNGFGPFIETPGWMKGANAGMKFNTVLWSILLGSLFYLLLRLITRRRLGSVIQSWLWLVDADEETIDEVSYRAIAIGFPLFTLGALIFAMIWAAEAWGRPWGWDPKEVWALITWFFYAIYLHLRLNSGWHGKRSSWMAVLGFVVVMITLVVVNLVIFGLHSYA